MSRALSNEDPVAGGAGKAEGLKPRAPIGKGRALAAAAVRPILPGMTMGGPALAVALFRARDDAALSVARLRKLGFRAISAPVIEIAPVRVRAAHKRYDAVVASSARAFAGGAIAEAASPLYVVGARTARAAEAIGWPPAAPPARDAARMVEILRRDLPRGASVLYLAGRDRKPTLEASLGEYALEVVEAYAAEARLSWRAPEIRALASCDAALHYSRRSAGLAARLAESSGLKERFLECATSVCRMMSRSP